MPGKQVTFEAAIGWFTDYCESKNLSRHTVSWYRRHLTDVQRFLGEVAVAEVKVTDLREWITSKLETTSAATVNHHITTLKTFYKFLADEDIVDHSPADRLPKIQATSRLIQPFSAEQVEAILDAPNERRFAGFRDRRLMLLLLDTALRISEALSIRIRDIDWDRGMIRVMGKGGKERLVPFGRTVRAALRDYIARRGEVASDLLFVNEFGDPATVGQIQNNIASYGRKAGITGVRVSPHTFRHTAAVNWIRNGGDVFSLQRLLGHTSLEMVRRYCNLASEDLERAHRVCSPVDRMLGAEEHGEKKQARKRIK